MEKILWNKLFPFFMILDADLRIQATGESLNKLLPDLHNRKFEEIGKIIRPKVDPVDFEQMLNIEDELCLIRISGVQHLFRGQIVRLDEQSLVLCMTLWLTDIEQLQALGLSFKDYALHSPIVEMLQTAKFNKITTSELVQKTRALQNSKKLLEIALKAKQDFLSVMTHEIRTPLNAVIGMSNILLEEAPRENQLEHMKTLKFSAENLLSLVNDILDYSKMEAGKFTLSREKVDLKNLVVQIVKTLTPRAQKQETELLTELDVDFHGYYWADQGRLTQILTNLIGNAVKFTEKGFVKVKVEAEQGEKPNRCKLNFAVQDSGLGIPEENLESIFEVFSQVESSTNRKHEGTGLGLPITAKLLKLFGSELKVESEFGKGSTFHFSLELERTVEEQEQATISDSSDLPLVWRENCRILLVEDNQINVKIVGRYLKKWKLPFEVARNGVEAVQKAQEGGFDLILMDLLMPIMDGYEATQKIRTLLQDSQPTLPIIALSASLFEEVRERVLGAGMTDFLNKPFRPNDLQKTLQKYLQAHSRITNPVSRS